jgi:hypothetical protein
MLVKSSAWTMSDDGDSYLFPEKERDASVVSDLDGIGSSSSYYSTRKDFFLRRLFWSTKVKCRDSVDACRERACQLKHWINLQSEAISGSLIFSSFVWTRIVVASVLVLAASSSTMWLFHPAPPTATDDLVTFVTNEKVHSEAANLSHQDIEDLQIQSMNVYARAHCAKGKEFASVR